MSQPISTAVKIGTAAEAPDGGAIPRHVAIIMDGNGRWAKARGLPRTAGHREGAEALRRIVRAAAEFGVDYLTVFGFSSENWKRPAAEVNDLMGLLRLYLRSEIAEIDRERRPPARDRRSRALVRRHHPADRGCRAAHRRQHAPQPDRGASAMAGAPRSCARRSSWRRPCAPAALTPRTSTRTRSSATCSPRTCRIPDLVIRTSGEKRISNFLLWQCAYAEFVFIDKLWPDFAGEDLKSAIAEFGGRKRRYGAAG